MTEVREHIGRMVREGMGPSEIGRHLTAMGFRTKSGGEFGKVRVSQVIGELYPKSGVVLEVGRCRRSFLSSLDTLRERAQDDDAAARLHASILSEQEQGRDLLDAVDAAVRVA